MIENIRLAFQGIWAHKMRSFLTMLGILLELLQLFRLSPQLKERMNRLKRI